MGERISTKDASQDVLATKHGLSWHLQSHQYSPYLINMFVTDLSSALCTHECVHGADMVLPVRERGPHQSSLGIYGWYSNIPVE